MRRLEAPRDMAEAHVTVQEARTARACEDYPTVGCVIAKGDEYVTWTIFPGSDILHGLTRPSRMSICLGHSPQWVRDAVTGSECAGARAHRREPDVSEHEHEQVGDGLMYSFPDQSRTCRICWQVYFPATQPSEHVAT